MDVAVLGATGDIGRAICAELIERRVLRPTSRLQLVGRAGGASGRAAHGLRVDLIDAHDEHAPLIDVATSPDEVVADVIVLAAGQTIPTGGGRVVDRDGLAAHNLSIFQDYAAAIAENGSGHEVVVVVSNPVELGVAVVAEQIGRHRVIGMGAWLDTLRFRREIASALGIRRQRVSGFVGGQHGDGAVPLWSSVHLRGLDVAERRDVIAGLRGPRTLASFGAEIADAKAQLAAVEADDIAGAFALTDSWAPDLQAVVRPYLTHQSGAKTAFGTASATVDLVDTVLDGREIVVAGQVMLDGEISLQGSPWCGPMGVPVVLGPDGWRNVLLEDLAEDEEERLAAVGHHINSAIEGWTR
ncbi:malate dehydrogenase [Microbacterium endophyticum]|uniref:Malate dehydrogenase n=1 Tax=Microbacterium endophyticum TaxID=1526412 RepID=A0A7W4V305_9MICO|nr:lactate dehydrogenase [Microbacterium endophyticum]MBB2975589.1 malate dehydrogenase [Microbacterium endophyticum]NIK35392.1 malate dehydrogenase [Microbacterium endophyticum]